MYRSPGSKQATTRYQRKLKHMISMDYILHSFYKMCVLLSQNIFFQVTAIVRLLVDDVELAVPLYSKSLYSM